MRSVAERAKLRLSVFPEKQRAESLTVSFGNLRLRRLQREAAGVAELVDARDSKSRFLGSMGSIPIAGIFSLESFFYKVLHGFWFLFSVRYLVNHNWIRNKL